MREKSELRCSFCRKSESEVAQLVAGPHVYICDSCVSLAADIIGKARRPPSEASAGVSWWRRALRRLGVRGPRGGRLCVARPAV